MPPQSCDRVTPTAHPTASATPPAYRRGPRHEAPRHRVDLAMTSLTPISRPRADAGAVNDDHPSGEVPERPRRRKFTPSTSSRCLLSTRRTRPRSGERYCVARACTPRIRSTGAAPAKLAHWLAWSRPEAGTGRPASLSRTTRGCGNATQGRGQPAHRATGDRGAERWALLKSRMMAVPRRTGFRLQVPWSIGRA